MLAHEPMHVIAWTTSRLLQSESWTCSPAHQRCQQMKFYALTCSRGRRSRFSGNVRILLEARFRTADLQPPTLEPFCVLLSPKPTTRSLSPISVHVHIRILVTRMWVIDWRPGILKRSLTCFSWRLAEKMSASSLKRIKATQETTRKPSGFFWRTDTASAAGTGETRKKDSSGLNHRLNSTQKICCDTSWIWMNRCWECQKC